MLHSIELSDELYRQAVTRFAGNAKVCLWQGDSGEVLAEIVERINAPTLFWLDGHYSGGKTAHGQEVTPIRRELQQIAGAKLLSSHVIVVDDARLFNGSNGYPTMEELQRLANGLGLTEFQIVTDLIIIRAV
jgi:hypothetical protein